MKVLRLAVIAGTSEATNLIAALPEQDSVTAFAATEYGKTILEGQHCMVRVGRLDADGFRFALRGMDAVIDASHPFAQVVTETVRQVCAELELPYFRLGRQKMTYDYSRVIRVESKEQAAACLAAIPGNILLTTGVNTLSFYEKAIPDFSTRGWARILDTPDSGRRQTPKRISFLQCRRFPKRIRWNCWKNITLRCWSPRTAAGVAVWQKKWMRQNKWTFR